jgi:hypothetical protein
VEVVARKNAANNHRYKPAVAQGAADQLLMRQFEERACEEMLGAVAAR